MTRPAASTATGEPPALAPKFAPHPPRGRVFTAARVVRGTDVTPDGRLAGHVNNSVHWAAVEDVLAGARWPPASAELEYHRPIQAGCEPRLVASEDRDHLWCRLLDGAQRLASARLTP